MNGGNGAGNGRDPLVSFSKLPPAMPMPNLLDVQVRAFQTLLETDKSIEERSDVGLERVFNEVFPITDVNDRFSLEFVNYSLGEPKYSVEECIERDMTFAAPLKATLRLIVWEEVEDQERRPKDIIEKEVYLGDLPLLTDLGTFIINGSERVIVSQLHRSPGVVFEETIHPNGSRLYSSRIIPFRGSWVEFTIDIHDVIFVHIDKKKKFPATALLRAFGHSSDESILRLFYSSREVDITEIDPDSRTQKRDVLGALLAEDVADPQTGEIIAETTEELNGDLHGRLMRAGISRVKVFAGADSRGDSPLLKNTLRKDPTENEEQALKAIYALLRPGDPPNVETARLALEKIFFNPKRYDLGRVGRYKINQRLKLDTPLHHTVLTQQDFIEIIRYLIALHEGRGDIDDIDHLGNRRVRSVGELIANQFSVGLSRMARLVKERMSITTDVEKMNIDDLVNARTVSAVIQAFFGSSQLSQFMDQTNPLAELTHKRRLSALGPGGLTRERAGFEVRDVHYSHYGRMCPIETPEGPNIGLITSLTTYASISDLGFIETPYRRVVNGKVTDEIVWLDANAEENETVAQANAPLDEQGRFKNEFVLCRHKGDFPLVPPSEISYMDVAPDQLVSVAAALIPFLEHDDANRALMGSNMQRQAVPLLYPDAPLVGTGLEEKVARDSGAVILTRRAGIVHRVTAEEIVIDTGTPGASKGNGEPLAKLAQYDRYKLKKYWRTNQDTAINQRPLVYLHQQVEAGQIIADGASTDHGELALGRNVTVAFMPWYGHNFEDAIVISEKLVKEDAYTSIHIQELELHVRDTKRGMEEITREIPNVAEESLTHLDERGIVRIGARVKSGDILVGKITPKGETELSPEEKLLTAIFGEKAKDVKDSSLKVPPGMEGTIIDVKVFSRRIDDPLLEKERGEKIGQLRAYEREEIQRISEARDEELRELLRNQTVTLMLKRGTVEPFLEEGSKLAQQQLEEIDLTEVDLTTLKVQNRESNERIRRLITEAKTRIDRVREKTEEQIDKVFQPDELSPGVVQLVKVYIAEKRKISVGDKMAGRHGNKGIIARIVPEEDMPFLPDGTPVEIVLNPLGVPSRMNVGQILETHLGWVCQLLGFEAKTPVFQGASEDEVGALIKLAGLHWAHAALGIRSAKFPAVSYSDVLGVLSAAEAQAAAEKGGRPALGRPLDDWMASTSPRSVRAKFDEVADYLRAGGEELLAAHEEKGKTPYPALSALVKKTAKASLDEAAVEFLGAAGLTPTGKVWLRDGRTGQAFEHPVTVGVIYMLKLSHLVDDKIHARSIGPYSLVTQQPLAGKAQFGGQRFGEMEVWALEAYGAAHTLQEILTVKSDDVSGRSRVYEAIVKGENLPEPGIPESFNVLVKELQSLGLSVTLGREE